MTSTNRVLGRTSRERRGTATGVLLMLILPSISNARGTHPLVITRGGTYTGTFESRDPSVSAVTIRTAEPVVLEHAIVRGAGDLIVSDHAHTNVTIRDVRGEAIPPTVAGRAAGRFVSIEGFDHVQIENCSLVGTSGIYLLDYDGDRTEANTVRIERNTARNIDGRVSDGKGGYTAKPQLVQFAQLDKVRRVPGMRIAWNEVINEPGKSSVEDVISIYLSSGTADSPVAIHDNFIRGAYPIDAADGDYSGGGIMLGDGKPKDPALDPAFVIAHDNVVIDTVNYGVAISAGHDLRFENNRILSAGQLPDGRRMKAQNVGAYVWDSYKAGPDRFFANGGSGNFIGWATPTGGRNDWWKPDAAFWTNNSSRPGKLTRDLYEAEHERWRAKAKAASIVIGPRSEPK